MLRILTPSSPPCSVRSDLISWSLTNSHPAPIFLGTFFQNPRAVNVHGSAGSTYTVSQTAPTTRLYAGAGSTVDDSFAPMTFIGAETVSLTTPLSHGTPNQIVTVSSDPADPQPVNLTFATSPNSLNLHNAGNGMFSLAGNSTNGGLFDKLASPIPRRYDPHRHQSWKRERLRDGYRGRGHDDQ